MITLSRALIAIAAVLLTLASANAERRAKTAEQACQAMALASISREWPNVLKGYYQIILKGGRCLVLLQTRAMSYEKVAAWLIDGKTGSLLSEFYAPINSDRGLCSSRGGQLFPTGECSWDEFLSRSDIHR